jgi:hypothetical protein
MSKYLFTGLMGLAALLGMAAAANAEVINVQFIGDSTLGTYSGQGAYADVGNNTWNGINSTWGTAMTAYNLMDSAGNLTSCSVSVANQVHNGSWSANTQQLLNGGIFTDNWDSISTKTFEIGGLTANQTYSLYLYSRGDDNQGSKFTIGGNTYTTTGTSGNEFVEGVTYVVFSATADSNGVIDGSWTTNGSTRWGPFNGIQIVSAPVPEPGTLALLVGGLFGLIAYAWRRHK